MCENDRYTSLCGPYNGVYSRAGEWDETNTNSELKVIVSLRFLFWILRITRVFIETG